MKCQEEIEKVLKDKGLEQVEVWVEAGLPRVWAEAAVVKEVVLQRALVATAYARTVVKEQLID